MITAIAAALALAPLLSARAEPPQASTVTAATTLTLDSCVNIALNQATAVLKSGYSARTSGVAVLESYGRFLPDLEASAAASRAWGRVFFTLARPSIEETTNYGASYQVTSALNLFNGFADYSHLKSAAERDRSAKLSLRRARQAVALDAAQTYFQVALDQEIVVIDESSLRVSQERQALLTEQTRVGATSIVDLYQQQAATSLADSALIAARARARDDLLLLLFKLRVDVSREWIIASVTLSSDTAQPPNEASLLDYALAHRPDVEAARRLSIAAEADVTTARAGYLPKADLSFGTASAARRYTREIVDGVDSRPASQTSIGQQLGDHVNFNLALDLNWFVFDRFVTRLSVARAKEQADDASVDYHDSVARAQADVRQAWTDYRAALAQVASSAARVDAAQKAFDAMRERYVVHAASFLDLITAQDVLTQARSLRAQALITLELERLALRYARGDDPF